MRTPTKISRTLALAAAAPASASTGAPAAAPAVADPVGVWVGLVDHSGDQTEVELSFQADHIVCLAPGEPGPSGGAEGRGFWWPLDTDEFGYIMTERLFDGDGDTVAWLLAFQEFTQAGDAADGTGSTQLFGPDWEYLGTFEVTVTLERVTATPVPC